MNNALSIAAQRNVLHLKLKFILTLLHSRTAVVGAKTVIRALQLTATQLHAVDMNAVSLTMCHAGHEEAFLIQTIIVRTLMMQANRT